ncbi:MAG: PrsW family intramembrane metalloprotease, partial [Lachnospiraceae bacterium]|nr:PrsW family intramembrane metalloprotease [Lachnospiraceae bacterium]
FAAFENIKYVFSYGLAVAFPRAILSIPGHLGFAIVFGYFYGRARIAASRGQRSRSKTNLIIGYILAVLMHGFYDTCAMTGTKASTIVFIVFVVIMYIFIIRLVKRESVTNEPIYSMFVE